ncbi:MAG TPA: hypothetical protein VGK10_09800 [Prolixibacteraceae bacterium]|jgi:hypothetical protein
MKHFIILLLSSLLFFPAMAQRSKKDQVFLKSGGVIKGQLITQDAEIVKINSAGNEWVFKNEEVDSISRYSRSRTEVHPAKGYFFDTSMGVLVGNSTSSHSAPFSFMSSVNVKILRNVYLGAGIGAEFLQETYLPAFGQIQWRFRDARTTPFFNLQLGYQLPIEDGNRQQQIGYYDYASISYPAYMPRNSKLTSEGGYLINPSFGFQRYSSDNFGWFFSFGYRYHQLNYSGENDYKLETNFSRLSLKIGFIFN